MTFDKNNDEVSESCTTTPLIKDQANSSVTIIKECDESISQKVF